MTRVTLTPADAADLCAEPYDTVRAAWDVARRLRAAGWRVFEWRQPISHPNRLVTVASVYHPDTHESPGDLLVHASTVLAPPQRQTEPGA